MSGTIFKSGDSVKCSLEGSPLMIVDYWEDGKVYCKYYNEKATKFETTDFAPSSLIKITYPEPDSKKEQPQYEITEIESHGGERRKLIDGLYRIYTDGVGFDLEYLLKREDSKIISVKRLSDGEVFTIGDKVDGVIGELFVITGFEHRKNVVGSPMCALGENNKAANILFIKKSTHNSNAQTPQPSEQEKDKEQRILDDEELQDLKKHLNKMVDKWRDVRDYPKGYILNAFETMISCMRILEEHIQKIKSHDQ